MHEYSIVQALIEQCETLATEHQATAIQKVEVKIGVLSGVEPYLLQTAFDAFKETSKVCEIAELVLEQQGLVGQCQSCGATLEIERLDTRCSVCQEGVLEMIDGDALMLMHLEMT